MPIYERRTEDGIVLERSVTFRGTDLDAQLSHAADNHDSPWHLVDEHGEMAIGSSVEPVFVEPSTPDGGDEEQDEQQDESDGEPSDDETEE